MLVMALSFRLCSTSIGRVHWAVNRSPLQGWDPSLGDPLTLFRFNSRFVPLSLTGNTLREPMNDWLGINAPLLGWRPRRLDNGDWGSIYLGDTSALPSDPVGAHIVVESRKGQTWTTTVTAVLDRSSEQVIVMTCPHERVHPLS